MFCTNCGTKIIAGGVFCNECGTPALQVNAAPAPAAPPAAPKKRKSRVWIPIAAGAAVLAIAFTALTLFTDIFPWSNNGGQEPAYTSSRRSDERSGDEEAASPGDTQAGGASQGSSHTHSSPAPDPNAPYGDILLEKFAHAESVAPEDNKLNLDITSVYYSEDGEDIRVRLVFETVNTMAIAAFSYFFDDEDNSNRVNGLECSLSGNIGAGEYLVIFVPRTTADRGMIVFFEGVTKDVSAEFETVPLFFLIELGDDPSVIAGPFYAGTMFDEDSGAGGSGQSSPGGAGESFPAEYIGHWEGSVDDIKLSFNVEPDGTGMYTFEQSGYVESFEFALEAGTETFSVRIPSNNSLNIASIGGTYEYNGGVLTLNVRTTFTGGRVFEYTIPCRRV